MHLPLDPSSRWLRFLRKKEPKAPNKKLLTNSRKPLAIIQGLLRTEANRWRAG